MLWLLLFSSLAFSQEPKVLEEIVVEAYRDIIVYVSPVRIVDMTSEGTNKEVGIDKQSAFTYSGTFWKNAKISETPNIWIPVTMGKRNLRIYSEDTIDLVWEDCNYKRQPLKCAVQNDHYYIDTVVHVDDNQLVVKSTMYNSAGQVIGSSRRSNDKIVRWIKQQELTVTTQQNSGLLGSGSTTTTVHKPKEEMPLKWEIPHHLTDSLMHQTMIGLWAGLKIHSN